MTVQQVIVACDLDDFIIYTRWRYTEAKLKCAAIIVRALAGRAPYDPEQLMDDLFRRNQGIDKKLMEELGFSPHRFPQSWVDTYREICREKGVEFDSDVAGKVRNAAKKFNHGPFRASPEAIETLRVLQAAGYGLHLVTAGDVAQQRHKIRQSGLESFFGEHIHIVDMDKQPVLKGLAESGAKHVFMAGDSLRADIEPALRAGVHAVWVPTHGHWQWDDAEVDMSKVTELTSIMELPEHIRKIVGRKRKPAKKKRAKAGRDSAKQQATA